MTGSLAATKDLRYKATMPKGQAEDPQITLACSGAVSPLQDQCSHRLIKRFGSELRETSLASDEADRQCQLYLPATRASASASSAADEGTYRFFTTDYDALLSTLDVDQVGGMPDSSSMTVHERIKPLRRSIGDLEDSNLSRLFRIIRDWVTETEEPVRPSTEERWRLSGEAADDDVRFLTLLADGEHKLLQREAGKEHWAWFSYLSRLFLTLAEDGRSLSGKEFLELILKEVRKRRFARRPPRPRTRRTRAERLLRLANSITPHAPPRLLSTEPFLTGAG